MAEAGLDRVVAYHSRFLKRTPWAILGALITFAIWLQTSPVFTMPHAQDTASIMVCASSVNDTLIRGDTGAIVVSLDSGDDSLAYASFSFQWQFSNGNIVGPLPHPFHPDYSSKAESTFESRVLNFGNGSDPETTFVSMTEFGIPPRWKGSGEAFRFEFVPLDTGIITIDPTFEGLSPEDRTWVVRLPALDFMEIAATSLPIAVVPCELIVVTGDVDRDGVINANDLVFLVSYVFKSGAPPQPVALAGDVNCTGETAASDIIYLVNFVFKSGSAPCDACSLLTIP